MSKELIREYKIKMKTLEHNICLMKMQMNSHKKSIRELKQKAKGEKDD